MRRSCFGLVLLLAGTAWSAEPADPAAFKHARVTDAWEAMTLMCGLPGAGKDTWLARHRPELPVVSLDKIRADLDVEATDDQGQVAQTARERCREMLRARRDFALNATNTISHTRKRWIDLAADYQARIIEIVYVEPPLQRILTQNKRRQDPVPEQVIEHLLHKLDPPTIAECHELRFG